MTGEQSSETGTTRDRTAGWPTWLCETVETVHGALDSADTQASLAKTLANSLTATSGVDYAWIGTEQGTSVRVRSAPSTAPLPLTLGTAGQETLTGIVSSNGDVCVSSDTHHADVDAAMTAADLNVERFGSVVGVPLHGEGTYYGVLHLSLGVADPDHEGVLGSVGRTIGRHLDAFETAEQLTRERRRLESLRSLVAHDLGNPLNIASGRVELARADGDLSHLDSVEAALEEIDQLMERGVTLVEVGKPLEETETISLATLAADSWDDVGQDRGELVAEEFQFVGERERVRMLLNELFRNTLDYSDGPVTVEVGPLSEREGFYVADDGPGIPDDEREYVMDTGYTTDPDRDGLGLSVVTEIAGAHGWDLALETSSSGGARIEIVVTRW
jgi:signal transduction histidine kinase